MLDATLLPYTSLLRQRGAAYLGRTHASGRETFEAVRSWIQGLRAVGVRVGYVAAAPFVDFGGHGYVAEAFRQMGCRVAGIQHGGNARLYARAGAPLLYTDFLGGLFFQWGAADCDEHRSAGIGHSCRFVRTGSPRTKELRRLRPSPFRHKRRVRARILYAPTVISVSTTLGNNFNWQEYARTVRDICNLLNDSDHECLVKLLPTPEVTSLDWNRYPNVKVLTSGGFVDYMWDVDYLIVDALGGSPLYEALVTDKPVLVHAGAQHQEWDAEFLAALRRRAIVFDDARAYVNGIRSFLAFPATYVERSGTTVSDELANRYMPPVSDRQLWQAIHSAMFAARDVVNS